MNKLNLISGILLLTSTVMAFAQEGPSRPRPDNPRPPPPPNQPNGADIEQRLQNIISERNLQAINTSELNLPPVSDEKVQLGKKLFFSQNLGGEQSVACASCHHPLLGGGDDLSLSIGVAAVDQFDNQAHALLGVGRFNGNDAQPVVARNAPTIFNIALYNRGLFWDSRVERLRNGAIATPDSAVTEQGRRLPDSNLPENTTLADAQARFPVTSNEEMRGDFNPDASNQNLRSALVSRLNDEITNISSQWPAAFANVYADQTITTDRLFDAIAEYERSMLFVNNPWQHYLSGDSTALTDEQKQGAILFFTASREGGAGCAACHNGANFSDERHHLVAFPQIGVGKGNISATLTSQDFGRENVTGNNNDKFHFRTPSLLNVAVTAPYGHTGAYQTLEQVVAHYNNPRRAIERLYAAQGQQPFADTQAPYCQLPQVNALVTKHNLSCQEIFSDSFANSIEVADYLAQARDGRVPASAPLRARANLSAIQIRQVTAFLHSLTDPCVTDKECLSPWLLDNDDLASYPDDQPLQAVNQNGDLL